MNKYPQYVNVCDDNGIIIKIPYKDVKEHEESIIRDNISYGFMHFEYSEEEIHEYAKRAHEELKELKRQIRENPDIILKMDKTTERYVVFSKD